MESEYKIKGCIVSRTWWAAAVQELSPDDRLAFYDGLLQYAFTDELPGNLPAAVRPMMAMVVPFIDADKVKYSERVERNRSNARRGKRVAASGSERLPVAPNSNTNTNTNTNNNTNTISITPEKEKFFVCAMFYARGAIKPAEETTRFWDYYESLGWRNNKGAQIVRKTAAARMWSLQTGTTERDIETRQTWARCMTTCDSARMEVFDLLQRVEVKGQELRLFARDCRQFAAIVEGDFLAGLQRFAAALECTKTTYYTA